MRLECRTRRKARHRTHFGGAEQVPAAVTLPTDEMCETDQRYEPDALLHRGKGLDGRHRQRPLPGGQPAADRVRAVRPLQCEPAHGARRDRPAAQPGAGVTAQARGHPGGGQQPARRLLAVAGQRGRPGPPGRNPAAGNPERAPFRRRTERSGAAGAGTGRALLLRVEHPRRPPAQCRAAVLDRCVRTARLCRGHRTGPRAPRPADCRVDRAALWPGDRGGRPAGAGSAADDRDGQSAEGRGGFTGVEDHPPLPRGKR